MTENQWTEYDGIATYLTSQSIADNANKLGAAIDFAASGTDRKLYMDIEVYLASVDLSGQTNPAIYGWVLASFNDLNASTCSFMARSVGRRSALEAP